MTALTLEQERFLEHPLIQFEPGCWLWNGSLKKPSGLDSSVAWGVLPVPDVYDGRLTATEMFWYLAPEHRRGTGAIRLLHAFEAWAVEKGAVQKESNAGWATGLAGGAQCGPMTYAASIDHTNC